MKVGVITWIARAAVMAALVWIVVRLIREMLEELN